MLIATTILGVAIAGIILYRRRKTTRNTNAKELSNTARDSFKEAEGQPQRIPIYTTG